MKFIQQTLYLNFILLTLYSCQQDKMLCPPNNITDIQADYFRLGIGNTINFSAPKLKDANYFWDFGDGETSDKRSPHKVFYEQGSYTITLTIEQSANECFDAREIIIPKSFNIGPGLFIEKIKIKNFRLKKEDGNDWDDDQSGPDIILNLGDVVISEVIDNFSVRNLPYEWDLSEYNIPYEGYKLKILDQDGDNNQEDINECNLNNFIFDLNNDDNKATFLDTNNFLDIEIICVEKESL